jgi:nanoRNase/pAp phosphatase (c-di-AMP/oligoRNAs hydrolase)
MDTGWFRHPNTKAQTLRTAADLVESGAEIDEVYRLLFERSTLSRLKLLGETLAGLRTDSAGGSPTPPSPATTSSGPAPSRRTPRTWSTTR